MRVAIVVLLVLLLIALTAVAACAVVHMQANDCELRILLPGVSIESCPPAKPAPAVEPPPTEPRALAPSDAPRRN